MYKSAFNHENMYFVKKYSNIQVKSCIKVKPSVEFNSKATHLHGLFSAILCLFAVLLEEASLVKKNYTKKASCFLYLKEIFILLESQ